MSKPSTPLVSIVIPAYRSERTIARTLLSLRAQTFCDYEVIVVDSDENDATARAVARFPSVRYVPTRERLFPHEARELAFALARGRVIVTTDPDAIADPAWLQNLLEAHAKTGGPIAGAILCTGDRLLHHGMHLHKFGRWNQRRSSGAIEIGPTINLLVPREQLAAVGGFRSGWMIGDAILSWKLTEGGFPLYFEPGAVVHHIHSGNLLSFLRERFRRGRELSQIRIERFRWPARKVVFWLVISVLPVRIFPSLRRELSQFRVRPNFTLAWNAGVALVGIGGIAAHLAGEAAGFLDYLRGKPAGRSDT